MREDTDQLVRNARQSLDDAGVLTDDQLAPNAAALAEAAMYLQQKHADYPGLVDSMRRYLDLAGNHAQGEANLTAAATHWKNLADTWPQNSHEHHVVLARAGATYFRAGRFGEALRLLEQADALAMQRGDEPQALDYRIPLAAAISETGRPENAYELLLHTVDRATALNLNALADRAATNAAVTALFLGKPDAAAELAHKADLSARQSGDIETSLRAQQVLASVHALRGEHTKAVAMLREVAAAAESAGQPRTRARALGNIGATLIEAGDMRGGRIALEQAHELFVQQGDLDAIAHTCMNLGAALCEEGLNEKALGYLEQAQSEFTRIEDVLGAHLAGINLAGCLMQLGRLPEAERKLSDERRAAESSEVEVSSAWFEIAGGLEAARGAHHLALQHFSKAVENAERGQINVYLAKSALGYARSAHELGRDKEALEYALKGVKALDSPGQSPRLDLVEALSFAAFCARAAGKREQSRALGTRALELADELPLLRESDTPRAQALVHELRMLQATAPVQR